MRRWCSGLLALALLGGCGDAGDDAFEVQGYQAFESGVAANRVGGASDHWIEMHNMAGEWERVGLIFGYTDDYTECLNAIAGLKKVNFAREYRCVPAN